MSVLTTARRALLAAGINQGINWLYYSRPDIVERAVGQSRTRYRHQASPSIDMQPTAVQDKNTTRFNEPFNGPLAYSTPKSKPKRRGGGLLGVTVILLPALLIGGLLLRDRARTTT